MNKHNDEIKYAEMFSKWYSWGSPIGLSVFLISLALTALIIIFSFSCLKTARCQKYTAPQQQL